MGVEVRAEWRCGIKECVVVILEVDPDTRPKGWSTVSIITTRLDGRIEIETFHACGDCTPKLKAMGEIHEPERKAPLMGHHITEQDQFQSDKHKDFPPDLKERPAT